jgi:peptide/nickel transport system permease protein
MAAATTVSQSFWHRRRHGFALGFRRYTRNRMALAGLCIFSFFVLLAVLAPLVARYNPEATLFLPNDPPSLKHLLGTTQTGQDIFSQFVYGAQTTLAIGVFAGLGTTIIGLAIGMTAGYRGGLTDALLTTITNIFLVMPILALLIVIESYLGTSTPLVTGLIITVTGWAWGARVFRSQTMSLVGRDFIVAARLSGMSAPRIMFQEIIPNMLSIIASNVMYACIGAILAESGLAYLGFESVDSTSWGTMLYWAQAGGAMLTGSWWWFVPPGLAIALVGVSLALMNFGIDAITNPRLRSSGRRVDRARRRQDPSAGA